MTNLADAKFHDDDAARAHLEALRWPDGPFCPHCGNAEPTTIRALKGKSHRPGLYQCNECREHFTVTVGSVMERSHIPLHKWVLGFHLMNSSKKGVSAHQLHRMLGITYKSAWFMAHRIREAMIDTDAGPIGGTGKIVEADETHFGSQENPTPSPRRRGQPYIKHKRTIRKRAVLALVERQGTARTFHVEAVTADEVRRLIVMNVSRDSNLHSDESNLYTRVGAEFADHQTVKHSAGEYVRGVVHSNTVESYFSVFKRGMKGVYQHCGEKHLQRYLTEFEFRHNRRTALGWSDDARAAAAIQGSEGKRLLYRGT